MTVAAPVMSSVPTTAGPMPGPSDRLRIGMSSVRNAQLIESMPRTMT